MAYNKSGGIFPSVRPIELISAISDGNGAGSAMTPVGGMCIGVVSIDERYSVLDRIETLTRILLVYVSVPVMM